MSEDTKVSKSGSSMPERKSWCVAREDERLWYFATEDEAVAFAEASVAVDPKWLLVVVRRGHGLFRCVRVIAPPDPTTSRREESA